MNLRTYSLAAVLTAVVAAGCLQPPEYPVEPVLTYVGISSDTMLQGSVTEDSVRVFLSFTDGDGDVSPAATDSVSNFFLENIRTGETVTDFATDPIPEEGAENGISGEISLRVFTTCCDYPDFVVAFPCTPSDQYPIDTLDLEAYMVDRAGNESNRVRIDPIYLICNR